MNQIEDPKLFDKRLKRQLIKINFDLENWEVLFGLFAENSIEVIWFTIFPFSLVYFLLLFELSSLI